MNNHNIPFSGLGLDMAENRRSPEQIDKFLKDKNAKAIIYYQGRFLSANKKLSMLHPSKIIGQDIYDPGPLFLGLKEGRPVFAFNLAHEHSALDLAKGAKLDHLRNLAYLLTDADLALAGMIKSYFEWHGTHVFCANCGNKSVGRNGGITRFCVACDTPHYPRINPATIMLIINGDNCLLGRQKAWPEHAWSALAGFISPGESIEEACIREVKEEVGLDIENVKYQFSQPWPFPHQLMIGIIADLKKGEKNEIVLQGHELSAARWFSKKDVIKAMNEDEDRIFIPPPPFTIARKLLEQWLGE